jgi:hypothetical protein
MKKVSQRINQVNLPLRPIRPRKRADYIQGIFDYWIGQSWTAL